MSLEAKDNITLIGKNLRNLRLSQEMTLNEVSEKSGFSISFLSQIEKAARKVKPMDLKRILDALQFPLSIFLSHVQNDIAQFPLNKEKIKRSRESFILIDGNRDRGYAVFLTSPVFDNNGSCTIEINIPPDFQTDTFSFSGSFLSIYAVKNNCVVLIGKTEEFLHEGENIMLNKPAAMIFRNSGKDTARIIIHLSYAAF